MDGMKPGMQACLQSLVDMRLMLGVGGRPDLLVAVDDDIDRNVFKFYVVNGAWNGKYINGRITVRHPTEPFSTLDQIEILCDNQDRLRGDYQDVFANYHDVNYKGPELKPFPADWDDDIPF